MARKAWDQLSQDYRDRLEKHGISREQHEAGRSLESARGHKNTPEHPERAEANPTKYKDYLGNRDKLINEIQRVKRELFGQSHKWKESQSKRNIKVDSVTGKVRTRAELTKILKAAEQLREEYRANPHDWSWQNVYDYFEEESDVSAFFYH